MKASLQAGFGLLEALVALVLLASVGFALFAWIQQDLDILQRLRERYQEQSTRRMVLDWSSALNPMRNTTGEFALGEARIVWKAEAAGDLTSQAGYPAGVGLYDLALYRVDVTVYRADVHEPWFKERFMRVGYRQARSRSNFLGTN